MEAFRETADLYERKLSEGAASAAGDGVRLGGLQSGRRQVPEIERRIEATENQLNLLLGRNPAADRPRR